MDLTDTPQTQARHVLDSIVATPAEVALAAKLLVVSSDHTANSERAEALGRLAALSHAVALREQGREGPLIPADPDLARPVIADLENFTKQVRIQLDEQLSIVTRRRARWLANTVLAALAAFLTPILFLIFTSGTSVTTTMTTLVGFSVASAVGTGVVSFRVFQSADETNRRLQEKLVSLTFLTNALDIVSSAPSTEKVLERSFDMFFRHYEGAQDPVNATDFWPSMKKG